MDLLEDLAFRYLQPDTYRRVAELLDERRGDREVWIAKASSILRNDDAFRASAVDAHIIVGFVRQTLHCNNG